ncbi:tachykinin-3-like isoform X1 [Xyrauchen texanus]|uniref:tachykinin-3-like isoform X1 n=1 Tax=Xyrauchen texanus TaxID=154827 RepID=UPI0022425398|nr:tachykinin-3-like isoform X1 [Xyrauchen texanus]
MYRALVILFLVLVLETQWIESGCQQPEFQRSVSNESPRFRVSAHNLLRRYNDIDYDSFVGLMGRRNADTDDGIPPQRKREMHDIFVGLMGRRSSDSDTGRPWRKEYPEPNEGIFFNKRKLRFRRGL